MISLNRLPLQLPGNVSATYGGSGGGRGMCGCSQSTFISLANQIRDVMPPGPPG